MYDEKEDHHHIIMLALILAYFFGLNLFQPSVSQIHAEGIESIVLVTGANQSAFNCSPEQIRTFAEAINQARHYLDDAGTTPPAQVDVTFKDGTRMNVWGYNQGFATLKTASGLQRNIRGKAPTGLVYESDVKLNANSATATGGCIDNCADILQVRR